MQKMKVLGSSRLFGEVQASGAKNAVLPILAATLLTSEAVVLHNVPQLTDVLLMQKLLISLGVTVKQTGSHSLFIQAKSLNTTSILSDDAQLMRGSVLTLGPLTARFGLAKLVLPGGCSIGARPIDQHIKALNALGANVEIDENHVQAKANRLLGTHIKTDMVTVTGTANIIMAAVLAEGLTVIENAACEPEIVDLVNLLKLMGANIRGEGTSCIEIIGVNALHGTEYTVMADRIEAGSFLCAAVATQGDVLVSGIQPTILANVTRKLHKMGCSIDFGNDWVRAKIQKRPLAVNIITEPHPGFPTDMQSQFMVLNAIAEGASCITETIFENRFMHVPELVKMGAQISVNGQNAHIQGVPNLYGAEVKATDLRASAALIIAALAAKGDSIINNIAYLDRGYESMETKLNQLGAKILRI